jgi:hypothetical protein
VDRAASSGAIGVLLGLVASGDASTFSLGGGTNFVPTLVITQSRANAIKANIAAPVNVTFSNSVTIPLVHGVVSSSSRGPGYSYNSIKPDIGAPGASVSAVVGTGTGEQAFGGTSGATPMISGSAALLLQAFPGLSSQEIKARLMNNAETAVFTNPAVSPGVLSPITRTSGGEVRVDRAAHASSAMWDAQDPVSVSLSFGTKRMTGVNTFKRKVVVTNYSSSAITYNISAAFRYASDDNGPVIITPDVSSILVPANGSATFAVTMTVNAAGLPDWNLNGGLLGGSGALLQGLEYDGYITLSSPNDTIRLPFQVLPHKAANVRPASTTVSLAGGTSAQLGLSNTGGATSGTVEVFSLTGTSKKMNPIFLPLPGDNYAIVDLRAAGVRLASAGPGQDAIQFAINTYGERAHPNYPAEFDVYVDSNNDGTWDYIVFNQELNGFGLTGQNVTTVFNLRTGGMVTNFFTDADLNSSNVIFTALLSDLGLTTSSKIRFSVYAFDNYFTGDLTDSIPGMRYKLDSPSYVASAPAPLIPGSTANLPINKNAAGLTDSPSQSGILLLYRDAQSGLEADPITVTP